MGINFDNIATLSDKAQGFLNKPIKLLIDGKWIEAKGKKSFESVDPSNGEVLAKIPSASSDDVDKAVSAARKALSGPWSQMTPNERGKILWKIAELIEANIDELAELETLDQGKPLYVGRWAEIPGAAEQFRYFAGETTNCLLYTSPSPRDS